MPTRDDVDDVEAFPYSTENQEARKVVLLAVEVEQIARSMRLGLVDPATCALAIVEALKGLPGLPA